MSRYLFDLAFTPAREIGFIEACDSFLARERGANLAEVLSGDPERERFLADALSGLRRPAKTLPFKYFYDAEGSKLFDQICALPEYYPTRTELRILRAHAAEMVDALGPETLLIEYGSGSSVKTRLLLDRLVRTVAYVPVDVSREHLLAAERGLRVD